MIELEAARNLFSPCLVGHAVGRHAVTQSLDSAVAATLAIRPRPSAAASPHPAIAGAIDHNLGPEALDVPFCFQPNATVDDV